METLGERVQRAMAAQRPTMTGKALAAAIEKDASWVSKLIHDNLKDTPGPRELVALERVLGIPVSWSLRALGYVSESEPSSGVAEPPALYDPNDPRAELIALLQQTPDLPEQAVRTMLLVAEQWEDYVKSRVVAVAPSPLPSPTFYDADPKGPRLW